MSDKTSEQPVKRGRGRPKKQPYVPLGDKPAQELLSLIDESRRREIEQEERRTEMAKKIAQYRLAVAEHYHRLPDGKTKLDLESRPFQKHILADDAMDIVIYGSAQWGKPLRDDSVISLPDGGFVRMGEVSAGTHVSTPDGGSAPVAAVFRKGRLATYRVVLADGASVVASGDHHWMVYCDRDGSPFKVTTLGIADLLSFGNKVWLPPGNCNGEKVPHRQVVSIRDAGESDCSCISVDHPSHLFFANDRVVCHNTEVLICHAVACAGICGLKVMWVISKAEKRNKFVADRIDPAFGTVPAYKKMFEVAKGRAATSDSTGLKHFGDGAINFIYATAEREFTSYATDVAIVDEYQECDKDNIGKIVHRMSGSDWGFMMRVGHPDVAGSESNPNLDFLYANSDRRTWKVPCPTCSKNLELDWHTHVVYEERNKQGGVLSVKPRDQEWRPDSPLDMRPICDECFRPVARLSLKGFWEPQRPGVRRHGYNLGNIYNPSPMCRLSVLYEEYLTARHNASKMQEFYNKTLGKTFDMESDKISESMLVSCANGSTGIPPYRFERADAILWKKADENPDGILVPV